MAIADITRASKNYLKRGMSVHVAPLIASDLLSDGSQTGNLPRETFIDEAYLVVKTVSAEASSTVDILVNGVVVANEVVVTALGKAVGTPDLTKAYQQTGGTIVVKGGAVSTTLSGLVCELVINYIEKDMHHGQMTTISQT